MHIDILDRLLGHDRWTTARVLELSRGLTDEALDRDFDIGHRTLRATLEHMIFSLEVWTGAMAGKWDNPPGGESSLDALAERQERAYTAFAALAQRVQKEQRLEEVFIDPWMDAPVHRTLGGTIVHVVLHDMQHRSETLHILQRLGVPDLPDGDPKEWEEAFGSS